MKSKIILSAFLLFSIINLKAQMKIVALHSTSNGVQYFSNESNADPLKLAYNAAIDGDTIYIPGGTFVQPTNYNKKLTIYGTGHFPSTTIATGSTVLNGNFVLGDNADNFHLEGVEINGGISFSSVASVDNLVVKRCKFSTFDTGSSANSSNTLFIENVITSGLNIPKLVGAQILNNIINGRITNAQTVIIKNNIFTYSDSFYAYLILTNVNSCLVNNNIFIDAYPHIASGQTNSFNHNILVNSTPNFGTDPIIGENYNLSLDNIFINYSGGVSNYDHDFHLKPAALAFLGTDGTEIGIFGSSTPFKDLSIPVNPHISSATISNEVNNGQINVNIQVQAQTK